MYPLSACSKLQQLSFITDEPYCKIMLLLVLSRIKSLKVLRLSQQGDPEMFDDIMWWLRDVGERWGSAVKIEEFWDDRYG